MGTIGRTTPTFIANTPAKAIEVNAEFDNLITFANGNIENVNIDTSADIAESKIDDISLNAPAAREVLDPQTSGNPALDGALTSEIQRLRYKAKQNGVGSSAVFFENGASTPTDCGWQELAIVSPNLLTNPSFEYYTTGSGTPPTAAPDGWELSAAIPATATIQLTAVTEGTGNDLKIISATGASEGVKQTVAGIKDSAYYLIGCRIKSVTSDAHVVITGDVVSGADYQDGTLVEDAVTYQTRSVVVLADTTPTDITVSLLTEGVGAGDQFRADHCFMYELGSDRIGYEFPLITTGSGNTLHRNPDNVAATVATTETKTYCPVSVTTLSDRPCYIEVTGTLSICADSNITADEVTIRLEHDIDGAGTWAAGYLTDSMLCPSNGQQNISGTVPIHFVVEDPSVGQQNDFRIEIDNNIGGGSGGTIYINQSHLGVGASVYESSLTAIVRSKV